MPEKKLSHSKTRAAALSAPAALSTPPERSPERSIVFDRRIVRLHRDRAARMLEAGLTDDFLYLEIAKRMADCLNDVKKSFPRVLDLGCRSGHLWPLVKQRCGNEIYLQADPSHGMARLAARNGNPTLVMEEEALALGEQKFDLVLAAGGLHWVNDLPGTLHQIRRALKPDGFFLGVYISGNSLSEARSAMYEAEEAVMGGTSCRFSPGFDLQAATGLLQRAGFTLTVGDLQTLTTGYDRVTKFITDMRGMGETNAHQKRPRHFAPRALIDAFISRLERQACHKEMNTEKETGVKREVKFKFEFLFVSGWTPAPSQQKPLKPGSAQYSLSQALK